MLKGIKNLRFREYFKVSSGGPHWTEKVFFFRVYHPMFPTIVFGLSVSLLLYFAQRAHHYSWTTLVITLGVGVLLWTLAEYCLHRFVFHWTKVREPWRKIFSGLHMAHHRDTKDRSLIMAPPTVAFVNSSLFFFILWGVTQSWSVALLLVAGIQLGYIFYEWVHYGSHEYRWNRGLFAYYKRYHLFHHFKAPNDAFGVTGPGWDHVFGTPKKA